MLGNTRILTKHLLDNEVWPFRAIGGNSWQWQINCNRHCCGSAPGKMRRRASTGSNSGRKLRPPMLAVTPEAGCRCRWSWPSDTTTNLSKCRAHCLVMDTSSRNLHRYCQCTPSVYFKKQQRKHNRLIETVNEMHTLESTCWHVDRPWSSFAMHSIHETLCLHCSLLRYGCITVVQKTTHDQ